MSLVKSLNSISKKDVDIVGGKGASLGEMMQTGISVPDGFVILSSAFDNFLKEVGLDVEIDVIMNSVDSRKIHTIENASREIQSLIIRAKISKELSAEILKYFHKLDRKYVAVRSSATVEDSDSATWAGQLESFLNTTEDNLFENVKKCWASLFTPRAIFYRFEKSLHKQKISVSVIVQEMIESEKSGIIFSVHPVTQDRDQMIIEAGFGLGEAIVSGAITPDSYVVSKKKEKIIGKNVNKQKKMLCRKNSGGNQWINIKTKGAEQVLNEIEIIELTKIGKRIEEYFKAPQDIEWAFAEGKFFILQSRPITTLGEATSDQTKNEQSEYTLHFSVSGLSILTLDIIFNNEDTYGAVDYLVLYENDISRIYLSARGMKECYDLGASLLDDEFFEKLWAESNDLLDQLGKYHPVRLNSQNVLIEWKKSLLLSKKLGKVYRFYEQPFQQALESHILKIVPKDELVEILSKHSFDSILNQRAKKYIKRLVSMGDMKLLIHEGSETFNTDYSFEKYVSRKNKIPLRLVSAMRKNEIEDAMAGKMTTTDELNKRLRGCVFKKENGEWNLYTGRKYIFWKNKIRETHNDEVAGDVAFPGVASYNGLGNLDRYNEATTPSSVYEKSIHTRPKS
jgi:hypothetical protein